MSSEVDPIDVTGARKAYKLLEKGDGHVDGHDASGRALLCQAKDY